MKTTALIFVAIALSAFAAEPTPHVEEKADKVDKEYRSPDGRFGLLVTKDPDGESYKDRVELIEPSTKRVLLLLSDPENYGADSSYSELDWSDDSQRVAAYTGGRKGGDTRIFMREGTGFAEVKLPELPALPQKPSVKVAKKSKGGFPIVRTTGDLVFVRWLKSGVVLERSNLFEGPSGTLSWSMEITLEIGANRQATIKNVVKKETFDES